MSALEIITAAYRAAGLYYTGETSRAMACDSENADRLHSQADRQTYLDAYTRAARVLLWCPVPIESLTDSYDLEDCRDGMSPEEIEKAALLIEIREAMEEVAA